VRTAPIGARFSIDTLSEDNLGIKVEEDGVRFIEHVDHLVDLWGRPRSAPPSLVDMTDTAPRVTCSVRRTSISPGSSRSGP